MRVLLDIDLKGFGFGLKLEVQEFVQFHTNLL